MEQVQRALRFIFFCVWAVVMTCLTYFLGAPSLKVLRRSLGRAKYWALTLAVSFSLVAISAKGYAALFFSLALLMGVFEEFEEMGFSFQVGAFFTLLINMLISAGAFALWVFYAGPNWSQRILALIEAAWKPVAEYAPQLQVNTFNLMMQLPSAIIMAWMIAIYVAVLLEGYISTGDLAADVSLPAMRPQLAAFRLPDACVWIFVAALLGSFGNFQIVAVEAISANAMNLCLVLFLFQGLAVVYKFFATVRIGAVWQALFVLVMFILQLFPLISLIGLLDYWLNFRERMTKRAEQINRET